MWARGQVLTHPYDGSTKLVITYTGNLLRSHLAVGLFS